MHASKLFQLSGIAFATRRASGAFASGQALAGASTLRAVAVVLALGGVAACGGDGDGTAVGETRSGAEVAVVQVADRPKVTTSLADVQAASIRLIGGPDWLTSHGGFIWVKRDDGIVTRIDPTTNRPSGEVRADTKSDQLCQGIGSGGGAVWSCSGSDVVRIDPKRLEVTASVPVGKTFDSGRLVFAGGKIWVLSGEGDRLVGIDTATVSVGSTVELPVPCNELGFGGDMVWAFCRASGTVLAVDPTSASVEARLELDEPSMGFATERDLWVGSAGSLLRIDLETLQPVARFVNLDPGLEGTVTVDGENVWVRTRAGFLHRIHAPSNTVAEQIAPADALSGGDVLPRGEWLWVTASDDALLLRLRVKT
jgi:DNA-binding beta-propeller fold protein YncE